MSDFPAIPGYQILKQMGQGGMATVYLAIQESFGRQVALKIMSDQLGKDDVWAKRFMHEARIVAQLSHSNIVPVFDVGSHNGHFYMAMELLKGGKLDERMATGLPVADAIRIVCGVAAGLDYAGSKGFVHRDIKPDNIMFRDDGTPVILDFGIAKQKDGDSKMTKTGTIVGTTGYMSPEQAMGQELDERSDIYSLGIMLYELLTGDVPFHGDSAVAVLLKHVQEVPPPLPDAVAVFQSALDKALAKKPEDRYQRANEMVEHLQDLLALYKQSQPTSTQRQSPRVDTAAATAVMAAPSPTPDRSTMPAQATASTDTVSPVATPAPTRKPKALAISVAAAVLLLAGGGLAWFWQKPAASHQAAPPAPVFAAAPAAATAPTQASEPTASARAATAETTPATVRPESAAPETAPADSAPAPAISPASPSGDSVARTTKPRSSPATASAENVKSIASKPSSDGSSDLDDASPESRRAIARILMGAHQCMKNRQYDCAKSKAEAALDLDPDNEVAKQILANAKKAQQEAFSGDWDAK